MPFGAEAGGAVPLGQITEFVVVVVVGVQLPLASQLFVVELVVVVVVVAPVEGSVVVVVPLCVPLVVAFGVEAPGVPAGRQVPVPFTDPHEPPAPIQPASGVPTG